MFATTSFLHLVAATCTIERFKFLGIEGWDKYIPATSVSTNGVTLCTLDFDAYGAGTFLLVLAGITDILLRVAVYVAVGYFIWGAIKMITSQGSPEGIKNARTTMTNAVIGLIICLLATQVLAFIMNRVLGAGF